MARTADVLVVGGGIMGVCTALALAERGASVWLLEKRHPGAGESGKSGAILRQHYSRPETVRMAREGLLAYKAVAEKYGASIGFTQPGMIFLVDAGDREGLRANVEMQRGLGVPTRMVDEQELSRIEPRGCFEEDIVGCFEADAGYVDPRRTLEALLATAQRLGVRTSYGEAVLSLLPKSPSGTFGQSGARVTGARTTHGEVHAAHTVLATGPWSVRLLRDWGFADVPLRIVRPQQAFLEPPAGYGAVGPVIGDLRLGYYWKDEGARHTRVGAMAYDDDPEVADPDEYDEGVDAGFLRACRDAVARRLPAFARATVWGGCGALYTVTPDAHPVIGPLPGLAGLTLVTGFSGHGFKLAPAVGRGVAEWILDGNPRAFPAALFDPARFRNGTGLSTGYRYRILG